MAPLEQMFHMRIAKIKRQQTAHRTGDSNVFDDITATGVETIAVQR